MSLQYAVDVPAAHARITGIGQLTMPAMTEAVDRVAGDARFKPHFTVILDIREAYYTAELEDGETFVATLRRRERDFQGAFVLLVAPALHFLGSMFCLLARASGVDRMRCTTDVREARAWCNLPPEP